MKSAANKTTKEASCQNVISIKIENEHAYKADGGSSEAVTVKEEPLAQDIGERSWTSWSDNHHQLQGNIKKECGSNTQLQYEFTRVTVKEEMELLMQEDSDGQEQEKDAENIQEECEEGAQVCTGRTNSE